MTSLDKEQSVWLHRFAVATAAATIVLIAIGGSVTSRGVGMAVPDWPSTYGHNLFLFPISQWIGGIFYEHVHRLAAAGVGLLTLVLAIWLMGQPGRQVLRWGGLGLGLTAAMLQPLISVKPESVVIAAMVSAGAVGASLFWPGGAPCSRTLRGLGFAAVGLVIFQGVLGGLRVTLYRDEIGIVHATLAQLFLLLLGAIALMTSRWWTGAADRDRSPVAALDSDLAKAAGSERPRSGIEGSWGGASARVLWLVTGAILVQLILGASMRHQHSGLAVPDFPLAYGRLWPALDDAAIERINQARVDVRDFKPITRGHILLHLAHRFWAVAVLAAVGSAAFLLGRRYGTMHPLARWGKVWFGLVLLQAILGAATVWSNKSADITTAHVVGGALSLLIGSSLALGAGRFGPTCGLAQAEGAAAGGLAGALTGMPSGCRTRG